MNEAAFSTNFHVYNGDGLPMQFTIRGVDFEDFQTNLWMFFERYPHLGGANLLLRDQPEKAMRSMTFRIVGWLRGDTKDKYDPNKIRPCVYLYGNLPHLDYSVATVYEEKLSLLPTEIDWKNARSVGNMAPMVAMAKTSMHPCDFQIVLEPQFDLSGAPVKNKNGKISYKFARVVNSSESGHVDGGQGEDVDFGPNGNKTEEATRKTEQKINQSAKDDLMVFAHVFSNPKVKISSDLMNLCNRLKNLDTSSSRKMSVARVENGEHKQGRYNFLAGLIDSLAGEPMHNKVLSMLLGRPITGNAEDLPGDNLGVFIEEIWPGSKTRTNEKFNPSIQALVKEAVGVCKVIDMASEFVG